jgi:signal transduction histidine kinase
LKKSISVELDLPDEGVRPILAFEIDWESILMNLISNAVWAIDEQENSGRRIRAVLRDEGSHIELRFADSGCGISAGTESDIFLPTFSTKRGSDGNVIGTGMGLAIVRSFVSDYSGSSITVIPTSDLGGAEFVIRVSIPDLRSRGARKKR